MLLQNPDKICWSFLSANTHPKAIKLLENNLDKINWSCLCMNPSAINIIEANPDKIKWEQLCVNENALHILEKNKDKIVWKFFSLNSGIFEYDYELIMQRMDSLREELIASFYHYDRLEHFNTLNSCNLDDFFGCHS